MRFRGKLVAGVTVLLLWGAQLMGALERIDFVVTRSSDPGWLGSTFHWLINMPGWPRWPCCFSAWGSPTGTRGDRRALHQWCRTLRTNSGN